HAECAGLDNRGHEAAHAKGTVVNPVHPAAVGMRRTREYRARIKYVLRAQGMQDVNKPNGDYRMVPVAASGDIQRGRDLRIAAGEIQLEFVTFDAKRDVDTARIPPDGILIRILRKLVLAVRDFAYEFARLLLC